MTWKKATRYHDDFKDEYGDKPHNEAWDRIRPGDKPHKEDEKWDDLIDPDNVLRQATECSREECGVLIKRGYHRLTVVITRVMEGKFIIETPQSFCSLCTPINESLWIQLVTPNEWKPPEGTRKQLYSLSGVEKTVWCDACGTVISVTEDRTTIGIHEIAPDIHHWRETKVLRFHPKCAPDSVYNPVLNGALLEQLQVHQEKLNEKTESVPAVLGPLRRAGIRSDTGHNGDGIPNSGDANVVTDELTARRNKARTLVNSGKVADEFERRVLDKWGNLGMTENEIAQTRGVSKLKVSGVIQTYAREHKDFAPVESTTAVPSAVTKHIEGLRRRRGNAEAEKFAALPLEEQIRVVNSRGGRFR